MQIPQAKLDWLGQIASIQGIPLEELKKYYEKHINDPTCIAAFPKEEELLDYVDNLLGTHIQEFHGAVMTEYEIVVFVSSAPKTSKAGNLYNSHVGMVKLPGDGQKFKWINIVNNEETGKVERLPILGTGTIKVNVKSENDLQIDAFSRPNTEFVPKLLSWVPADINERKNWMKKNIRQTTIADVGKNLSVKTQDGKGINPCSLRWIQGTISQRRIIKRVDEKTQIERNTGILNITDKTCVTIPDFGKPKQVPDPKNPGKTMTEYGGFSGFIDPEDIKDIGKDSECIYVGTLSSSRSMNIGTIIPILTVAPKKPTDRLQRSNVPTTPQETQGVSPTSL